MACGTHRTTTPESMPATPSPPRSSSSFARRHAHETDKLSSRNSSTVVLDLGQVAFHGDANPGRGSGAVGERDGQRRRARHPVEVPAGRDRSVLELELTTLHASATYDGHVPHVHVSPYGLGVGLVIVKALSEQLGVEVQRRQPLDTALSAEARARPSRTRRQNGAHRHSRRGPSARATGQFPSARRRPRRRSKRFREAAGGLEENVAERARREP
jgi:hypothetical protein